MQAELNDVRDRLITSPTIANGKFSHDVFVAVCSSIVP
jgi:hypothetical protein